MADRLKDIGGRSPRAVGPVRITLPAKVAYDPEALKENIASVLERMGCPSCFSGADCFFQSERSFVLGDATPRSEPEPSPWATGLAARPKHQAVIALAPAVKFDIDKVFVAIDRTIDILGTHPCFSGWDALFQNELIVVNPELEAQQF
ncbi:MAG: hypothetical protein M3394_06130 [Actinomycetota bacterium]|nr:hypothetical protein [Actinomycetota bacterium]